MPTTKDLRKPKVLHIDHEGYDLPALWNVNGPVERGFTLIGRLGTPVKIGRAPWVSVWSRIAFMMETQRVWNVDREASARAYAKKQEGWARRDEREGARAEKKTKARHGSLTIEKLRRTKLLRGWDGAMPPTRLAEGRAMLATLLDALEKRAGDAKKQHAALRATVTAFNRWNDKHGVIETAERESLYETLIDIGAAAKLDDASATIERVRDW
jgi:hypothetical protein